MAQQASEMQRCLEEYMASPFEDFKGFAFAKLAEANNLSVSALQEGLHLNPDGTIARIDLHGRGLCVLPDAFRYLHIHGDLDLSDNRLSSLPPFFKEEIFVGGVLNLIGNTLEATRRSFYFPCESRSRRLHYVRERRR